MAPNCWCGRPPDPSGRDQPRQRPSRKSGRLRVDRHVELPLQLDEPLDRRVRHQFAGDLEDLPQLAVAHRVIVGECAALVVLASDDVIERVGQELGISEGVADAVTGDR